MTDPADDRDDVTDDEGTPRWVQAFGVFALVVVLLFLVLLIFGSPGGHGLRRHVATMDADGRTLASGGVVGRGPLGSHRRGSA